MPPERFDWSDQQLPQGGAAPAGHAPAGLAEAAPPQVSAPASGPTPMPDLVVRTQRSAHEFLAGNTYRIGRDPESDIVMTDSRVSWRHGVLRVDRDGWILEDLNSTNGTFLGPQRVDRVDISQDCVIRLGHPDDGPILRCMPQGPADPPDSIGPGPSVPPDAPGPTPVGRVPGGPAEVGSCSGDPGSVGARPGGPSSMGPVPRGGGRPAARCRVLVRAPGGLFAPPSRSASSPARGPAPPARGGAPSARRTPSPARPCVG
jgi:hypothetical protein